MEPAPNVICFSHYQSGLLKNFPSCAFVEFTTRMILLGHTMVTSQSIGKGAWGSITKISKTKKDWDAFSPMTGIPKDAKETFLLPTEKTISNREAVQEENFIQEMEIVRAPSSQKQPPRRRSRLRKNKEIMGVQVA
jgi:hypothetical protein